MIIQIYFKMITLIYRKGNGTETIKRRNKVIHEGRELDLIDFSDTTSMKPFCEIRFKDTQERFLEIQDRINLDFLYKKTKVKTKNETFK